MTDQLTGLESMTRADLADPMNRTSDRIREVIGQLRLTRLFDAVSDEDAERLVRRLEADLGVVQTIGSMFSETGHVAWLNAARQFIEPYYWDRYRRHLTQAGLPPAVVTTLDHVTDRILGLLQNPKSEGIWDRRGMVVGHVQSGKTANYTGLICKAADAGYKLIVVIAGRTQQSAEPDTAENR